MSLFDKVNGQPQMTVQDIQKDPIGMAQKVGYQIPQNLAGNPQAMVQHLIQTGQVGGPALQRVMPLIRQMTGK